MSKVNLGANTSSASALQGYLSGMSRTIETNEYIGSVISYVSSTLGEAFGMAVDAAARNMPESFMHVYEWGRDYQDYSTVGHEQSRLWRLTSTGRGAKRTMGYAFLPSVKPVPINPILLEAGSTGKTVKSGLHVFTWKAPIMEYGIRVTIKRRPGTDYLAFVGDDGEIKFRKGPFSFTPGSKSTQGVFTGFFLAWWNTEGPDLYDKSIRRELENNVTNETKLASATRRFVTKSKTFEINSNYAGQRTFNQAKRQAEKDMKKAQREYQNKSAQKRLRKYGI